MELHFNNVSIKLKKELNALDILTTDFTSILNELNIKYVLVAGYVSILFGRSRSSEDVDIIIEKLDLNKFKDLWTNLNDKFECITTKNPEEAYSDYLISELAIRFSKKDKFIPNIEAKFPKVEIESWALKQRKEVILNNKKMFISPIELQISFKLYLGSEKDIEDAKHLYELFKDKIDLSALEEFNRKFKIEEAFNKYLK